MGDSFSSTDPIFFSDAYSEAEMEYMLKRIDMKEYLVRENFVENKEKSTKIETVYSREYDISVKIGTKGFYIWRVLGNGKTPGGTLDKLFKHFHGTEGAAMREYVKRWWYGEFDTFRKNFASGKKTDPILTKETTIAQVKTFDFDTHVSEKAQSPESPQFSYSPAVNLQFFLERGITQETLDHPAFKDRFGNSEGPFGTDKAEDSSYKSSEFVYSHHVIVPLWDVQGRLVGLEAKNKLTAEAYAKYVEREMNKKGGRPLKVRKNPARFYKGSSRGAWISGIPETVSHLLSGEHPTDSMSYREVHKSDSRMDQTIFLDTCGSATAEYFAVMTSLIREHRPKSVFLAYDRNLAGLMYTLSTIQNLPFNNVGKQLMQVEFSEVRNFGVGVNFLLKEQLQVITAEEIRARAVEVRDALSKHFHFEGDVQFVPALAIRETFATVYIPYTLNNAAELVRLAQVILKSPPGFYEFKSPILAVDWNDEHLGIVTPIETPAPLLLDQPATRNRIFINESNSILFHQRNLTWDHNIKEVLGRLNVFARRNPVSLHQNIIGHDFIIDAAGQLESAYLQAMPRFDDSWMDSLMRQGISFAPLTGEFAQGERLIAVWDAEKGRCQEKVSLAERERIVLHWMSTSIKNGRDVTQDRKLLRIAEYDKVYYNDRLIGKISLSFSFQEIDDLKVSTLGDIASSQIKLFTLGLQDVRGKWKKFRELYPEPIDHIESENLIFFEKKVGLFTYDATNNEIAFTGDPAAILNRNFNPFFYKALQLFLENQGTFFNYIRLMRVDYEEGVVFYNRRDQEVARLIEHEGKQYYAPYPGIPESMRRELEVFSPLPQASPELIQRLGLELQPKGLSSKIKEHRISTVPFAYTRFFDDREREFIIMPEDKLRNKSTSYRALYMEAYLWHMNNIAPKPAGATVQRDNFLERDGAIFFNRILVAEYNVERDTLDLVVPPAQKYYRALAIFERNLVQNPDNRVFSQYLLEAVPEEKADLSLSEEISRFLDQIDYTEFSENSGEFYTMDMKYEKQLMGVVKEGVMTVDESYLKYSPIVQDALGKIATARAWKLKWESVAQEALAQKQVTISEINIAMPEKPFAHTLLTTPTGLLQSITNVPIFEGKLRLSAMGEVELEFMANKYGSPILSVTTNWSKFEKPLYWMSKKPEFCNTIILSNDPKQALLYFQYNLPDTLSGAEMYVAAVNASPKEAVAAIEPLISAYGINEVRIICDDEFGKGVKRLMKDTRVAIFPILTQPQSVARIERYLGAYQASTEYQPILESLHGHNFMNIASGIGLFPMKGTAASSFAVLGRGLHFTKDVDALWISRPLRHSTRVVLVSDQEEAIHYMALNRDYIAKDAIVSFQKQVTAKQVESLNEMLRLPRFYNQIYVANTGRLSEQLLDMHFKHKFEIEKPFKDTSFRNGYLAMKDMYADVKRSVRLSRRRGLSESVVSPGKSNALAMSMSPWPGQQNTISSIHTIK